MTGASWGAVGEVWRIGPAQRDRRARVAPSADVRVGFGASPLL